MGSLLLADRQGAVWDYRELRQDQVPERLKNYTQYARSV